MGDVPEKQLTVAEARAMAYRYLGHREHSCSELTSKLERRGVAPGVASETVQQLESEGLVSDLRFTESFIRSRISRHQGPFKIRADLNKRGIDARLAGEVLAQHDDMWFEIARQWVEKRMTGNFDKKEKARLYRSGTSRGFSHEHIMRALDCAQRIE